MRLCRPEIIRFLIFEAYPCEFGLHIRGHVVATQPKDGKAVTLISVGGTNTGS